MGKHPTSLPASEANCEASSGMSMRPLGQAGHAGQHQENAEDSTARRKGGWTASPPRSQLQELGWAASPRTDAQESFGPL